MESRSNDNDLVSTIMRLALVLLFSICTIIILSSCAPAQEEANKENLLPEVDVLQLKESSDAALKMARQMRMDIDAINTRLAELERIVVDLNTSMDNLPLARIEEMQNQLVLMNEELQTLKIMVEEGAKIPTFHPKKDFSTPKPMDAPAQYNAGLKAFDAQNYLEAVRYLESVTVKYPQGHYTDDSYYWIGESHFRLGDYARAIAAYQKVFGFLNTDKGDDSQFKIAICYLKLGDRRRAANEFKKVEVLYPESDYVKKAKTELKKIGVQ